MKGLEWGRLYETYKNTPYDPENVGEKVDELLANEGVTDKKGIFEYVLGGCKDTKLLNIRIFDNNIKESVYQQQTNSAKKRGVSNCPDCEKLGNDEQKTKIYELKEMNADHVTAWSKGGVTTEKKLYDALQIPQQEKGEPLTFKFYIFNHRAKRHIRDENARLFLHSSAKLFLPAFLRLRDLENCSIA